MNLLTLGGLFIILAECFETSEPATKLIITIKGDNMDIATFNARYPDENANLGNNFSGYFVELDDPTGCNEDLSIVDKQDGEENVNNFITYIDWSDKSENPCPFFKMTEDLRGIDITYFVLILPRSSRTFEEGPVDGVNFVLLDTQDPPTVEEFKQLVSRSGQLRSIEVEAHKENENPSTIPMSSMAILFVTVAFVTLMTVSIGWLVFYYAQRCRQRNMRERMQSRLCVAAKRAVSKLPTKTVPDLPKSNKKIKKSAPTNIPDNDSTCSSLSSNEDADFCPVCLDLYKPREVIRILPCKHEFHKNCVDPWLFDHRTCPMCKLDILEHLGMPSGGDRLDTPVVQQPPPVPEPVENVSGRVDQEVQTDFVNPPSPQQQISSVAVRITADDEIEPAPISPPAV